MELPEMNTLPQLVAYWEDLLEKEKIKQEEQKGYCIEELKKEIMQSIEEEKKFKELIREEKLKLEEKERIFIENRQLEIEDQAAKITEKFSSLLDKEEEYRYNQISEHGNLIKEIKKKRDEHKILFEKELEDLQKKNSCTTDKVDHVNINRVQRCSNMFEKLGISKLFNDNPKETIDIMKDLCNNS